MSAYFETHEASPYHPEIVSWSPRRYRFPFVLRRRVDEVLVLRWRKGRRFEVNDHPATNGLLYEHLSNVPVYYKRRNSDNDILSWRDVATAVNAARMELPTKIADWTESQREMRQVARTSDDHLYVIAGGGYVKIGRSADPKKRIKAIQRGCPIPLSLAAVFRRRGNDERRIHFEFDEYRIHGEWFEADGRLGRFAELAAQFSPPTDQDN